MTKHGVRPGTVQETLLIPLYGRAVENGKEQAALRDPRAGEIVAAIDYDFSRFDGLPSLTGAVLRTALFDLWVTDFLSAHPSGTVVELGAGLNTRHERVDCAQARWFDLDLPDVTELRRTFFTDTARRTTIAASVTDPSWPATVEADACGPYFFCAEAVLPFLEETDVRRVLGMIAERFPGSLLALDTAGPGIVGAQDDHDALSKVEARMRWSCADPAELAVWLPGTEVLAAHTLSGLPGRMYEQLPAAYREMLDGLAEQRLPQVEEYRLCLVRLP
ncbi:O-methyltransferase involved in polyketide biosynthesis [Streptomyces sp. Amel2xB2]|uniref:class I SAM-dependent methyltransferase n=1 Tax=Streptomyces sp. Amel2xB2 TaxID=1305829 RepID=UPI000DC02C3E|nr:class I SAM-dependent methyltransferase [Streptomyces sp. Amel2xB2]RAJ67189.1 O-methyltransferase involved in polyketide biosynthesis [Streptomyces sp. Amel2xB2]